MDAPGVEQAHPTVAVVALDHDVPVAIDDVRPNAPLAFVPLASAAAFLKPYLDGTTGLDGEVGRLRYRRELSRAILPPKPLCDPSEHRGSELGIRSRLAAEHLAAEHLAAEHLAAEH